MTLDRYRGCLLGLACGDALGGPYEFKSRDEIRQLAPGGPREFVGGGWLSLFPGEITDDTQMALAIAESLANGGRLDMNDIAARFISWYESDHKDIGNITRASIRGLKDGQSWDGAGERVRQERGDRAAGNGSVMRCAPVALRFRGRPELIQGSIDTARITHADPRCTASAVAINQAIAYLLDGHSRASVSEAATTNLDQTETRAAIEHAPALTESTVPNGGYVLDTITAAFWALANHDSLEETLVAVVALGGDTDTSGAVTGALVGAHYGAGAIPERWLALVQHRDRLTWLADRLFELNQT